MSTNPYQDIITLVRETPNQTAKIFQAFEDAKQSGMHSSNLRNLLDIAFKSEEFAKNIPTDSQQTKAVMDLLAEFPDARRELAANPMASAEILRELAQYDMDYVVILNLKEQVAKRYDLKDIKVGFDHLKTNEQELDAIVSLLNEVSDKVHVPMKDIKIIDETSIGIEKESFYIYLADSKPKITFQGWKYHERAYELTESYYSPGNRDEPDSQDEHELGIYSSISQVVTQAFAAHVRMEVAQYIELKGEAEWAQQEAEDAKARQEEEHSMDM